MKTLVAGWFSFEDMGATAGDLMARDIVCDWLRCAGHTYELAHAGPFEGGVDWRRADPREYSHVVFVCGPFGNGEPVTDFLAHFAGCRLVGVDLTMLEQLDRWNPFDLLYERDSPATAHPDLAMLSDTPLVPVVGVVLVHSQKHPGAMHDVAHAAIERLIATSEVAAVSIDTRLDIPNAGGLRTPAQVESLIARMDAVVTTRLHGMVLALKTGVPPVVVDPIRAGDKVLKQAGALGWPVAFTADALDDRALTEALAYCLTQEARDEARRARERARTQLEHTRDDFIARLAMTGA